MDSPVERLNLADLPADELPKLEAIVRNAKHEVVAHTEAPLVSLIVSPAHKLLYLEAACTSDSGAHALMGCVSDPRGAVSFRYFTHAGETAVEIIPPESAVAANTRMVIPGWSRHVHHVAILDRSGELVLAGTDAGLWRKLRGLMSCPTLDEWGTALMPVVHRSRLLRECEAFGIPDGFRAYVLAPDAQKTFDGLVAAHVRAMGGLWRIAS